MEYSVVRGWDELPDSARTLLAAAGRRSLFSGESWYETYSHQVIEPSQMRPLWILLRDGDATRLVLPLLELRRRGAKILRSLSNYYTPYYGAVTDGDADAPLASLVDEAGALLRGYDLIEFAPLTAGSLASLRQVGQRLGFLETTRIHTWNWRELNIAGFDSYWAARSSRLRNTVQRRLRQLTEDDEFRFSIASAGTLERAILDYQTVYARSWKGKENFPAFIDTLIRKFAARGNLRLGILHRGDEAVAAQLWLINAGTAYIYKLAYDPQYQQKSVGTLLTHYMFRRVVEDDQVHTVDYLTGDDSYKAEWMSERRPLYRLTLTNPRRPVGAMLALRQRIADYLRNPDPAELTDD